jgi:hypothetical protein
VTQWGELSGDRCRRRGLLAWVGAAVVSALPLLAQPISDPLQRWDLRYPLLPELGEIIFAAGVFVGVPSSGDGPPFISQDGVNWTHASLPADADAAHLAMSRLAFGNETYVGVSPAGEVYASANGRNWNFLGFTPVTDFDPSRPVEIAAGNGVVVTANAVHGVAASADGISWTSPALQDVCPERLCFGNGRFLLVSGNPCAGPPALYASLDGLNWVRLTAPATPALIDARFSEGLFTGVTSAGELLTSSDAVNWQRLSLLPLADGAIPSHFIHANGRFVGLIVQPSGETEVLSSSDGRNWSSTGTTVTARGVAYGDGLFVISGREMLISSDGFSWDKHRGDLGALPTSIAFGNGRLVAVGGDRELYSDDGKTWRVATPNTFRRPAGVYFANGMFFGPSGPSYQDDDVTGIQGYLLTSADGLTWTEHAGPSFLSSLRSIVYGNGVFVAIGDGQSLFSSLDGITWAEQIRVEFLSKVLFGNGMFLAAASAGTSTVPPASIDPTPAVYSSFIYGSPDGITWTRLSTFDARIVTLATFGAGLFVAQSLGPIGRDILTSPDGVVWTTVYSGKNPGIAPAAYAAFGAGVFLLLSPYVLLSSADGVTWSERPVDAALRLAEEALHPALVFGADSFFTVVRGAIQQASPLLDPVSAPPQISTGGITRTASGSLQLVIQSLPGAAFVVEASTDLVTWTTLTNLVSLTGVVAFTDSPISGGSHRFYRLRSPAPPTASPAGGQGTAGSGL